MPLPVQDVLCHRELVRKTYINHLGRRQLTRPPDHSKARLSNGRRDSFRLRASPRVSGRSYSYTSPFRDRGSHVCRECIEVAVRKVADAGRVAVSGKVEHPGWVPLPGVTSLFGAEANVGIIILIGEIGYPPGRFMSNEADTK